MSTTASAYLLVLLLVLVPTTAARAELTLRVESTQPARVYLDTTHRGMTPIVFTQLAPGTHEVLIERVDTGEYQIFPVSSDANRSVTVNLYADFVGPSRVVESVVMRESYDVEPSSRGRRTPAPLVGQFTAPDYRPVTPPQTVVVVPADRSTGRTVTVHGPSRDKVRRRNTILGLGAVNEIANDGRRRKDVRKGVIGATLLNELLTR